MLTATRTSLRVSSASSSRAIGCAGRGSVARALHRRLHAHTRRSPSRRRRSARALSDASPHSASAPARSRGSSPERFHRHDLHGRRGSRRGGGRRARPRGRESRRGGRRVRQGQDQRGCGRAHQGGPEARSAAAAQARPPRPGQGGGGAAGDVRREAGSHRGAEARHRDPPGRTQDRRRGIHEHEDQDPGAQPAVSGAHGTWFAHPDRVRRSPIATTVSTRTHPAASAARRSRRTLFVRRERAFSRRRKNEKTKKRKSENASALVSVSPVRVFSLARSRRRADLVCRRTQTAITATTARHHSYDIRTSATPSARS